MYAKLVEKHKNIGYTNMVILYNLFFFIDAKLLVIAMAQLRVDQV
jgi:hypothetical protein